jgi:hypothetical protein
MAGTQQFTTSQFNGTSSSPFRQTLARGMITGVGLFNEIKK